jgi:hypothetical protein|tara:strand:- start:4891 stop:5406 length:516 start_codon:yes stop_codon:yes gene_type:complete
MEYKIFGFITLFILLLSFYPAFGQAPIVDLPFRFTFLITDKTIYESGDDILFEAQIMNESPDHDIIITMEAKASFLDNNLMSEPVTIPKNSTGSVTITIPSKEDTYGRNIVRLHATAISTTNDSLTGSDTTLFQAVFEDEKVSYIPIALFLIVVGIVGGFVYYSTRDLDEV